MQNNLKLFLTGYRATGKTSVGKSVANRLSIEFIDMDRIIEKNEGALISEMVQQHGWPYFRALEANLLEKLAEKNESVVVATGGGAILHQEIWPKIMAAGMVVWLSADTGIICDRLNGDSKTASQRPSLTGSGTVDEVTRVLSEREPLYKAGCHISIDTSNRSIEQLSENILKEHQIFCASKS